MSVIQVFVVVLLVIFCWRDTRKPYLFPPGPRWMPLIGALPMVKKLQGVCHHFYMVWHNLYLQYGSVVGLRIGRDHLIVVSGKEAIKEFYGIAEFNGRPDGFFYRIRSFDRRLGVVFSDGPFWEMQRKFSLKVLRQLGMGRSNMIEHIEHEAATMIEHLMRLSDGGLPISIDQAFDVPVLNVLWALLAGHRFHLEDKRLSQLIKLIHDSFRVIDMSGGVLNQFPAVRYIAPNACGYRPLMNTLGPLWSFLKEVIGEIRNSKTDEEPRSFIETYLTEIERNVNDKNSSFTEEQLLSLCLDFFQAGTETTSNTLAFGIVHLLHNVRVQEKLRAEMDSAIGRSRLPNLNDRSLLPYTEAVICEIQRISNVAPLAIVHRCMETVKFRGYVIPRDTMALVSLYSLHMDEAYWGDPCVFRPERFVNEYGQFVNHECFMPFGLGQRRCMGEQLAKSSLFLFFASFVHSFEMRVPIGADLPDTQGLDGITLSPKPFSVILTHRLLSE